MHGTLTLASLLHDHLAVHLHHRFHGPHVDYIGVGLAATVSWMGVPGVGEAALIAAGIAAAHHKVDIGGMIAVGTAGAIVGGTCGWWAGLKGGRALVTAPGALLAWRHRLLDSGERVYARYGSLAGLLRPVMDGGHQRHAPGAVPPSQRDLGRGVGPRRRPRRLLRRAEHPTEVLSDIRDPSGIAVAGWSWWWPAW